MAWDGLGWPVMYGMRGGGSGQGQLCMAMHSAAVDNCAWQCTLKPWAMHSPSLAVCSLQSNTW